MRSMGQRTLGVLAASSILLVTAACGDSDGGSKNDDDSGAASGAMNAAVGKVLNASDKKGGIVRLADEGQQDSVDPGDTYYGYSWNFIRLYGRSLTMFNPAPGLASSEVIPDLAEALGEASDESKTWTYHLREGVKFEDGTEVKAADVKYGIMRSFDKEIFPDGPTYYDSLLAWPDGFKGAYKTPDMDVSSAIETPDEYTIVLHFKAPFSDMDALSTTPQGMPVPQAKDTGAKYKEHVLSTGPYKFKSYEDGKQFTLERNDQWDPATDPNRQALPDGYEVSLNVDAEDIATRVASGDLDIAYASVGVTPAMQAKALTDPKLKSRLDNPDALRLQYTSINPTVPPFDNIHCRLAIQYGMDRIAYQTAYGGALAGGVPATTMMLPATPGYEKFDLYPTDDFKGDLEKAKAELAECGQPDGFETKISYRTERPYEKATAEAFQQQLEKIGIKLTPKGYPKTDYFSTYAGNPPFVKKTGLGLVVNSWGADWNDGFGLLSQIVDSRVIRDTGGSSNTSVRIPEVDKLLDEASIETDVDERNAYYSQIDKLVMEDAVVYPGLYAKLLHMRSDNLTNVFINDQYGGYDFLSVGVK